MNTTVSHFRLYAETKNNGGKRKVCTKWIQFRSMFRPCGAKVSSFITLSRSFLADIVFRLMSQLMSCECFLVVL